MSSIFFSGEKSSKEEAVAALMEEMPDYTDERFWVRFESDDTSNHLTAIIESKFNATTPDPALDASAYVSNLSPVLIL